MAAVQSRHMGRRRLFTLVFLTCFCAAAFGADPPAREQAVLNHLSATAAWYQRVVAGGQAQSDPGEVLFRDAVNRSSRQALDLGFEFARAEAERARGAAAAATTAPSPTTAASQPARGRRLEAAAGSAAARAAQLQADLDAVEREIASAAPADAPALAARRDRLASELNLANVRRDVLQ
jgi:hypothetical protein